MVDALEKLFAAKAALLAEEEAREPYAQLEEQGLARRSERRRFARALSASAGPAIVAEIKRASPSVGLIAKHFDAQAIAAEYDSAGADAISVLTETDHFLGDLAFLDVARKASSRPILRKDFLLSRYHMAQAAAHGADAVLLIAAGLPDGLLAELTAEARRFDLDVVLEVHDEAELQRGLAAKPDVLGINNRDLRTFQTDLGTTEYLLPMVPAGVIVMSESGVSEPADITRLHELGARAFLVGEALMRAEDRQALLRRLKGDVLVR
jgi:indole-3-glycerol phosphate synthase